MCKREEARFREKVEEIRQSIDEGGLPFANLLSVELVHKVLERCKVSFRERIYTPWTTLCVFLTQLLSADHSCAHAVCNLIAWLTSRNQEPCSPNTGSYCTARSRLPENFYEELMRQTGKGLSDQTPEVWLWKGRNVKVVDGTTASMPDTEENQAEYPQSDQQAPGLGFPLVRIVVLFSLAVGTVLERAVGPYKGKKTGEISLFRTLEDRLEPGDVLLADRYYCTYAEIAELRRNHVDLVVKLHQARDCDFSQGRRLGKNDHIVTWTKPRQCPPGLDREVFKRLPKTMEVREVKVAVQQKGFRVKCFVVVTTLLDADQYSSEEIAELYRRRWMSELYLRDIKITLQMDILRCESPEMIRKEILVHLLAYNLVRIQMAQAALCSGQHPHQISFKGALQAIEAFRDRFVCVRDTHAQAVLVATIAYRQVGNRPDRCEPRAIKRRPKPHRLLTEPRDQARKCLDKYA